jgi:hypothetical protein
MVGTMKVYILVGVGKHYCENIRTAFNVEDARQMLEAASNSEYDGNYAWFKVETWTPAGRVAVNLKAEEIQ